MKKYVCSICGYVYDEEKGIPEASIAPGTKWEELPDGWVCPICKANKGMFKLKDDEPKEDASDTNISAHYEKELSPIEMSIICSNLARGCEKQYLFEQSEAFSMLTDFFKSKSVKSSENDVASLMDLINDDLSKGFVNGKNAASEAGDRGSLRCQTWSEKVTMMLKSILMRYEAEGEKMLSNTGIYVCTICGFVFVGDAPPDMCPVCKVPNWKFEKVERR